MRFRPAHQSVINRRYDDRAPCPVRQSLETLLEREPRNPRVYQELAQAYMQLERGQDALRILREFKKTGIHNDYVDELLDRLRRQ